MGGCPLTVWGWPHKLWHWPLTTQHVNWPLVFCLKRNIALYQAWSGFDEILVQIWLELDWRGFCLISSRYLICHFWTTAPRIFYPQVGIRKDMQPSFTLPPTACSLFCCCGLKPHSLSSNYRMLAGFCAFWCKTHCLIRKWTVEVEKNWVASLSCSAFLLLLELGLRKVWEKEKKCSSLVGPRTVPLCGTIELILSLEWSDFPTSRYKNRIAVH